MAGKADFTDEEWDALQKGVTGSGMLVSAAHRDFTDSFGEAKAIAKHLAAQGDSESQLVRELSDTHGTGFGLVGEVGLPCHRSSRTSNAVSTGPILAAATPRLPTASPHPLSLPRRAPSVVAGATRWLCLRRAPEQGDAEPGEHHPDHVSEMDAVAARERQHDDVPPVRVEPGEGRPNDDRTGSSDLAHARQCR